MMMIQLCTHTIQADILLDVATCDGSWSIKEGRVIIWTEVDLKGWDGRG